MVQATKCQYTSVRVYPNRTKPWNRLLFCTKRIANVETPAIRTPRKAATVSETLPILLGIGGSSMLDLDGARHVQQEIFETMKLGMAQC